MDSNTSLPVELSMFKCLLCVRSFLTSFAIYDEQMFNLHAFQHGISRNVIGFNTPLSLGQVKMLRLRSVCKRYCPTILLT